jgi:hypothetical protein
MTGQLAVNHNLDAVSGPFQRPSIALPARSGNEFQKIGQSLHPRPIKQRYSEAIGDPLDVIVDQYYRDNVGYIVEEHANKKRSPVGTVFFVGIQTNGLISYYAVTCAHVVNPDKDGVRPLFIRVNTQNAYSDIPCPRKRWIVSDHSDVAVSEVLSGPGKFPQDAKIWAYPMQHHAYFTGPAIGQSVFMAGLFSPVPGDNRVEALIRLGSVAREHCKIPVTVNMSAPKQKQTVDACWIQAMGWAGESGSPVYVYEPKHELNDMSLYSSPRVETVTEPMLVGLLHGHFPLGDGPNRPNSGIAIVVPVRDMWELLGNKVLVERRNRSLDEIRKRSAPRVNPASSK